MTQLLKYDLIPFAEYLAGERDSDSIFEFFVLDK